MSTDFFVLHCPCGWGWTGHTERHHKMMHRLHSKKCGQLAKFIPLPHSCATLYKVDKGQDLTQQAAKVLKAPNTLITDPATYRAPNAN